jgi:hypothetical protein
MANVSQLAVAEVSRGFEASPRQRYVKRLR